MLRGGLCFGNASRNPKLWSKQMQQTGPTHTQRRENRVRTTTPSSPELTIQTAGEWRTESPAHSLAASQEHGRPYGFQAFWSQSHLSRGKLWDGRSRLFGTLPSPAAWQKCSDPKGFPFHGKCWNSGFIPNWNETKFCKIEIVHKMKWLFMAGLRWLMQTACNWEEPPKRAFQSEFPGLSLPRTQLTSQLTSALLQEGSAQHQQNVIRMWWALPLIWQFLWRVHVHTLLLPFLVRLVQLNYGESLFPTHTLFSQTWGFHMAASNITINSVSTCCCWAQSGRLLCTLFAGSLQRVPLH